MANFSENLESLFAVAAELTGEHREAFLDEKCADDADLRSHLTRLLQAHDRVNHQLDKPILVPDALESTCLSENRSAGTVIAGRYKLLEQIGDGGMGTVWMAEQKEPVKRLVAVKLIKAGMDSKSVLARFAAERQALALMDHPNIAKVHDAGTDENGRPYFAMELVKGLPLTEYCDVRKLSVSERLDLFVQICSAVQHAHQKAIIHRDLKPANVLVTEHDGKPVPKVIDFGLAKALNASQMLTERTLHTAYGTVVGTPLYMAPEQVGINALDVDTRTDIYALGVILYELLTGTTPLEKARFKEAAWEEMKRLIREEEPPRPSTRLSTNEALPSLAASRQVDAAKLPNLVRGELDWIVMKALEKDRDRRYDTANGLSKDVQRYLKGDTVEACPPSFGYRLQKAYRRNKAVVWVSTAFMGLIMSAALMGVWLAVRAETARRGEVAARQRAEAREVEANEQRELAMREQRRAEEEKRAAEAVRSFLQDDLIRKADLHTQILAMPLSGSEFRYEQNPTLHELLDRAAAQLTPERIEAKFPGMPFVQAEVLHALSAGYSGITQDEKSLALVDRALELYQATRGPDDRATLTARYQQAMQYYFLGQKDRAEKALRSVVAELHRVFGPNDRTAFDAQIYIGRLMIENDLAAEAVKYFRSLTEAGRAAFGNDDSLTLLAAGHVAFALRQSGNSTAALKEIEAIHQSMRGMKARPDHPLLAAALDELAETYKATGRTADAIDVWQDDLDSWAQRGEAFHPSTWRSRNKLALMLSQIGETEKAMKTFSENIQATLGPQYTLLSNEGAMRMAIKLGRDDDALIFAKNGLAAVLTGQPSSFRSWWTGMGQLKVGELLLRRKQYEEAEPLLQAAVADLVEFHDDRPSFDTGGQSYSAHRALVELYSATSRPIEAARVQASLQTLLSSGTLQGGKPWDAFHAGDFESAALIFEALISSSPKAEEKSKAYHGLFLTEQKLGKLDDARKHARAAIEVIVQARGPEHRSYLLGMSRAALGGLLYELGEAADAEPHLLAGCTEVAEHADQIPSYDYPHRYVPFDQLVRILAAAKMAMEKPGQTLDATGLVHEAYLKLSSNHEFKDSQHFFRVAAEAMRQILVDRARSRKRLRHGGDRDRVNLSEAASLVDVPDNDLLALDEALAQFSQLDPLKAELVKLRYFAGLSEQDAANALQISRATASRHWAYARAWLIQAMENTN